MGISNNILLVLTLLLVLVSLFGTVTLLNNIEFTQYPDGGSPTVKNGEVKIEILPEPTKSMSTTGYMSVKILPEGE
jgi:hypothetical protein